MDCEDRKLTKSSLWWLNNVHTAEWTNTALHIQTVQVAML